MIPYHKVGSKLVAELDLCNPPTNVTLYVDDICIHKREAREGRALVWVNPPLHVGSMAKYLRRAAQTTEGVVHRTLEEVCRAVLGLLTDEDRFIWVAPDQAVVGWLAANGLKNFTEMPVVFDDDRVIALVSNAIVHCVSRPSIWGRDADQNFRSLFKTFPEVKYVFDPCGGDHPLMGVTAEFCRDYYGVEISSLQCMKRIGYMQRNGRIMEKPDQIQRPTSGVAGAPVAVASAEALQYNPSVGRLMRSMDKRGVGTARSSGDPRQAAPGRAQGGLGRVQAQPQGGLRAGGNDADADMERRRRLIEQRREQVWRKR